MRDPICMGCKHEPSALSEYAEPAAKEGVSVEQYVRREEGTYNPTNGHFLCTPCYIRAGMPTEPHGWRCP